MSTDGSDTDEFERMLFIDVKLRARVPSGVSATELISDVDDSLQRSCGYFPYDRVTGSDVKRDAPYIEMYDGATITKRTGLPKADPLHARRSIPQTFEECP